MGREIAFVHPLLRLTQSNAISKSAKSKEKILDITAKKDKML